MIILTILYYCLATISAFVALGSGAMAYANHDDDSMFTYLLSSMVAAFITLECITTSITLGG